MKKQNEKNKITPEKRILLGIVLIMPVTILAWEDYLFPNISDNVYSIILVLVIISVTLGIYNICRANEERKPKAETPDKPKKIIKNGRIVEVDVSGKIIEPKENKKEKKKIPLFYRIPYELMFNGLFFLWAIAGGFIAEYSETSWLLRYFPTKNFLMGMLLSVDTIVCLGIWFLYMGYFNSKSKRILFLVLIVLIYIGFYLYIRQY